MISAPVQRVLADGTVGDALSKLGQTGEAIAVFFGAGLIIFYAAGRATGRLHRPLTITVLPL